MENVDRHIQFLKLALIGQLGNHKDVGTYTEVGPIVADDQTIPIAIFSNLNGFIDAAQYPFADGIVRAGEFQTKHSIADIMKNYLTVFKYWRLIAVVVQDDQGFAAWDTGVGFFGWIVAKALSTLTFVKAGMPGSEHFFDPVSYFFTLGFGTLDAFFQADQVPIFKRTILPAITSLHGVVNAVKLIGDFWNAVGGVGEQPIE